MKKFYLLLLALLLVSGASAQSCLPQGITFTSQAQIDSFQINYPNCMEIEGDVTIGGSDIANLNGLNGLTSIGGRLLIGDFNGGNPSLTSLKGLEGLTSIGGGFDIFSNNALTSLTGLEGLTSVGYIQFSSNNVLTSLTGLEGLTSIEGSLFIGSNDALTSLTGLEGLNYIGCDIIIEYNASLTSLTGLEGLTSIEGGLSIGSNDALIGLTGLDNVTYIGGGIGIGSNAALNNLTGLEGLTSIGWSLEIRNNNALTSLTGLGNLTSTPGYLSIDYNTALTSLTGLDNVTYIGRSLKICGNDALTNLTGLESLNSIGSGLLIFYNYALNSLADLENLTSIGNYLAIEGNTSLTNLTGLDNLTSIGYNLSIFNNTALSTCEAEWLCDYLSNPSGVVQIFDNAPGCNSVVELANACGGSMPCLPYGDYIFINQTDIDNFQLAFPNCTELNGSVKIGGGDVSNLNGLNALSSIGDDLYIAGNDSLHSLMGLEGLNTIGGSLDIGHYNFGNPLLTSLTGLEGLTSIGDTLMICYIRICNNSSLTSLTGLDNFDAEPIYVLYIYNNPLLSTCELQSICDYLAIPSNSAEIYSNTTGCNSREEVDTACVYLSNGEVNLPPTFAIYPNPTSNHITIEFPTTPQKNTIMTIYYINGQQLISRQITEPNTVVEVSELSQGVYFVRVTDDRAVMVGKFVKN